MSDRQPNPWLARLTDRLIRTRVACLTAVAAITLLALSQFPKLVIDNSNEAFFVDGDPTQEQLDAFRDTFGNDDFAFVLLELEDAFAPQAIARVGELAERLELEVPHVLEMTWIGNVEWIQGVPGGIVIEPLIGDTNAAPAALASARERALSDPLYRDRLVSADGTTVGLLLEFDNYPEGGIDPRKDSPPVIAAIIAEFPDLRAYVVGGPVSDYEMDMRTADEAPRWFAMALLGMFAALAFTTRSVLGVLVPAATVVLSVIWTLGFIAAIGFTLNLFVILVPTLLLCVGIGDSMHVVAEMNQLRREGQDTKAALGGTIDLVSKPILLTTITTAAGFLAFLATDLQPLRELGIQAAIGVTVALLLTYLFAVPVLSYARQRKSEQAARTRSDVFDLLLARTADLVARSGTAVGIGALVFAGVVGFGITRLEIDTNTINSMNPDEPLRVAFEYVDETMGGSMSIELVASAGRDDGIKDTAFLSKVARLQAYLDEHPRVTQTSSVLDQLKQMNRAVNENAAAAYRLPDRNSQIAEYLLLYESGGGSQLEQFVSFTYDALRIQARTRSLDFAAVRDLTNDIETFVRDELDGELDVHATGTLPLFQHLGDLVAEGQARSVVLALIAIALILVLALRSLTLGLLAMVPNVLPVLIGLGAMGWLGAEFNLVMAVLAPMVLGVAVDDTVHFFTRFRRYFDERQDYTEAYRETMRTVGRPLLFTTLVLMAGFIGFYFSVFDGPRNFAVASLIAFSSALLAEFLVAPALLRWFKPLGPDKHAKAQTDAAPALHA
ncbi:MAG: MMPL family transporter [Pseudomonadota bacterium]